MATWPIQYPFPQWIDYASHIPIQLIPAHFTYQDCLTIAGDHMGKYLSTLIKRQTLNHYMEISTMYLISYLSDFNLIHSSYSQDPKGRDDP